MSLSVYANGMGFAHKGSGGTGTAPLDVCLTPPPPPAGPVPVPYVNICSSGDISKGSKTVKIDGEATALEDASEFSTSSGDEAGTQGGGVVTHKTKGKASFKLWSFDVKVEGKGVGRHGDLVIQNTASDPPNCVDMAFVNRFKKVLGPNYGKPCKRKYTKQFRPEQDPSREQVDKVKNKPCWECKRDTGETAAVWRTSVKGWLGGKLKVVLRRNRKHKQHHSRGAGDMTHDHQPPLAVAWEMGGCHMSAEEFRKHFEKASTVKPHCRAHAQSQGSQAKAFAAEVRRRAKAGVSLF